MCNNMCNDMCNNMRNNMHNNMCNNMCHGIPSDRPGNTLAAHACRGQIRSAAHRELGIHVCMTPTPTPERPRPRPRPSTHMHRHMYRHMHRHRHMHMHMHMHLRMRMRMRMRTSCADARVSNVHTCMCSRTYARRFVNRCASQKPPQMHAKHMATATACHAVQCSGAHGLRRITFRCFGRRRTRFGACIAH